MTKLSNLPAKQRGFVRKSRATSVAGKMYEKAMENAFSSPAGRIPEYRPSSFPLCSILTYMNLVKGASLGYFERERSAASDYFTSVGTTAHENIQYHMGFSKRIFGDWKCINPICPERQKAQTLYNQHNELIQKGRLTRKNTTNNECPCCGQAMEYVEKEINFNGLCGHIDGIIRLPDGRFWIVDYKTTTRNKIDKKILPQKAHLKQIPAYCYAIKKRYMKKIAGFSIIYFSRDNPFNFFEHSQEWSSDWDKYCKKLLLGERSKFIAGVDSFRTLDHKHAVRNKPCKTLAFYEKEMAFYTECPMLNVCFDEKKLWKTLDSFVQEYPTDRSTREKLISTINIE